MRDSLALIYVAPMRHLGMYKHLTGHTTHATRCVRFSLRLYTGLRVLLPSDLRSRLDNLVQRH